LSINVDNNIKNTFEIATCKCNKIYSGQVYDRFVGMEETYKNTRSVKDF